MGKKQKSKTHNSTYYFLVKLDLKEVLSSCPRCYFSICDQEVLGMES